MQPLKNCICNEASTKWISLYCKEFDLSSWIFGDGQQTNKMGYQTLEDIWFSDSWLVSSFMGKRWYNLLGERSNWTETKVVCENVNWTKLGRRVEWYPQKWRPGCQPKLDEIRCSYPNKGDMFSFWQDALASIWETFSPLLAWWIRFFMGLLVTNQL